VETWEGNGQINGCLVLVGTDSVQYSSVLTVTVEISTKYSFQLSLSLPLNSDPWLLPKRPLVKKLYDVLPRLI
jgi:hypothetical protein